MAVGTEPASASENITPSSCRDDVQRLVLVLQKSAQESDLDYDDTLSSTHLRNSNVSQFFDLYSKKANVPLDALDCLTFTLDFAGGIEEVVRQGDETAWGKLIRKIRGLFKLRSRRQPSVKIFEIVVEIGDKKTGVVAGAHDDDVW